VAMNNLSVVSAVVEGEVMCGKGLFQEPLTLVNNGCGEAANCQVVLCEDFTYSLQTTADVRAGEEFLFTYTNDGAFEKTFFTPCLCPKCAPPSPQKTPDVEELVRLFTGATLHGFEDQHAGLHGQRLKESSWEFTFNPAGVVPGALARALYPQALQLLWVNQCWTSHFLVHHLVCQPISIKGSRVVSVHLVAHNSGRPWICPNPTVVMRVGPNVEKQHSLFYHELGKGAQHIIVVVQTEDKRVFAVDPTHRQFGNPASTAVTELKDPSDRPPYLQQLSTTWRAPELNYSLQDTLHRFREESDSFASALPRKLKSCRTCSKEEETLFRCGHCKSVYYCSRACQVSNWTGHHKAYCWLLAKLN
jgi:hypothetical protein